MFKNKSHFYQVLATTPFAIAGELIPQMLEEENTVWFLLLSDTVVFHEDEIKKATMDGMFITVTSTENIRYHLSLLKPVMGDALDELIKSHA